MCSINCTLGGIFAPMSPSPRSIDPFVREPDNRVKVDCSDKTNFPTADNPETNRSRQCFVCCRVGVSRLCRSLSSGHESDHNTRLGFMTRYPSYSARLPGREIVPSNAKPEEFGYAAGRLMVLVTSRVNGFPTLSWKVSLKTIESGVIFVT